MRKLIFLCRRVPGLTHEQYAQRLLDDHVPIALRHHPSLRRYVVNVVEGVRTPSSRELDSIGELSFETLEDYRERLYDSEAGREIVGRDVARFLGEAHAYECSEFVQKDRTAPPLLLRRSPGAKLIAAMRRRPGMPHAEFVDHWLQRHVPLALEHHPALVKYVTNVVDSRLSPDGEELDGIAELHFASEEDLRERMYGSAQARRAIEEDIPRFIGELQAWLVAEHVCRPA